MSQVAIVLLAAGASARMRGADKLLEPVEGVPLLRRQAQAALATGAPVYVTLPDPAPARRAALNGVPVHQVPVPGTGDGMAASLRAGIAALPDDCPGAMIVLADMPELTGADFHTVLNEFKCEAEALILRGATVDGQPGHPVLFPADLFADLSRLSGDHGAQPVLRAHAGRVRLVALPGRHAITDLDTPEDWRAWRSRD